MIALVTKRHSKSRKLIMYIRQVTLLLLDKS